MPRIVLEQTILEHEPLAISRPRRAEVKMIRMRCHQFSISTFSVAGPNLITLRAGEMKGDPLMIRTHAKTIRQSFAGSCERPHIAPIQIHAQHLAKFAARDL